MKHVHRRPPLRVVLVSSPAFCGGLIEAPPTPKAKLCAKCSLPPRSAGASLKPQADGSPLWLYPVVFPRVLRGPH